jgi:DNA mismatch repair protein MutS
MVSTARWTSCGAHRVRGNWIGELQEREIAATGIKSLKVRFNSVLRLLHRSHELESSGLPAHYTRKQTTVGGERFITPS